MCNFSILAGSIEHKSGAAARRGGGNHLLLCYVISELLLLRVVQRQFLDSTPSFVSTSTSFELSSFGCCDRDRYGSILSGIGHSK